MLESMEKRGSPVNAHRVATAYFESFRKDRNIPEGPGDKGLPADEATAVDTGVESEVVTAVSSAVKKNPGERKTPKGSVKTTAQDGDPFLTPSELRVYDVIYKVSKGQDKEGVRIGLKELRELAGLSDKTVRMAVHSLTEKLSIEVVEKSLGVYGRKYKVYGLDEVHERRLEGGLVVDPVTKKMLVRARISTTAVDIPVSSAVTTAVDTTVTTAVITAVVKPETGIADIEAFFEKYSGEEPGGGIRAFCEKNSEAHAGVIEAAVILSALKRRGGKMSVEDVEGELGRLEGPLPAGYLEGLREVWESLKKAGDAR